MRQPQCGKEKPNVQDSWLLQDSKLQAATQPKTIDTTQPQDSIIREISKSNNTISTNTLDIPRNDSLDSKEITPDTQNSSIYSHITQAQYDIATIQQKQSYNTLQQHNAMITSNKKITQLSQCSNPIQYRIYPLCRYIAPTKQWI